MEQTQKPNRKQGCLKGIVIIVILYGLCKGCSTYRNRPAGLYQRWFKTPVPEDVSDLKGGYQFRLTESTAWLRFNTPPERIAQIVKDRGLSLVEAHPHWSIRSNSRTFSCGKASGSGNWLWRSEKWAYSTPPDQQIYWITNHPDNTHFSSGWALYYSPSTQEAYFALETI